MDYEEAKEKIVAELTKKLKSKSKFYFNDLAKILGEKPRLAKTNITPKSAKKPFDSSSALAQSVDVLRISICSGSVSRLTSLTSGSGPNGSTPAATVRTGA